MQTCCKFIAFGLAAIALSAARGAVPTEWQVRIGPKATVYQAERYHGDALDLRATLTSGGLPLVYQGAARLFAQTNGMGALWWDLAPVTVASNVLAATWRPEFDTGADVVDVFLGAPSNFQAHARIRFLPSPGPAPNSLPLPTPVLDFSAVDLVNVAALTNGWSFGSTIDRSYCTNYTHSALGAFAATGTVARALSYGTPTRWIDATGCVWEVSFGLSPWSFSGAGVANYSNLSVTTNEDIYILSDNGVFVDYGSEFGRDLLEVHFANATVVATRSLIPSSTNVVGRVALTNDISDAISTNNAAFVSAVLAVPLAAVEHVSNLVETVRTESQLVYRLYSGSNVVAEVTNYNSQVHAPELRLMQLNESNEYVTVWAETNGLARTLRDATNYAARATADYAAPRAWSRTTSGLGAEAPANTTWISTPTTVIAGGFEYAKFVDTYGEVWVLSSNGMAAEFNPDTNAYFRITADDGTPVFSVEKTDAQLAGANAAGITVGESTITIPVPVDSSTAPTMYWRSSLSSGDWADESAVNPNYMSVDWTGGRGSWVCTISFDGSRPPMMCFKFNFLQEGVVVIRNNATTDLSSGIYVGGVKFVPSVSGNNLIWTKQ